MPRGHKTVRSIQIGDAASPISQVAAGTPRAKQSRTARRSPCLLRGACCAVPATPFGSYATDQTRRSDSSSSVQPRAALRAAITRSTEAVVIVPSTNSESDRSAFCSGMFVRIPPMMYSSSARVMRLIACSRVEA